MGFKKQNSRKKAENGDFQVVGSLLYAHYPMYEGCPESFETMSVSQCHLYALQ